MFKTSDGCPIAYTVHSAPNAPRLVLIHSLALDASVWDGVVARLAGRAEILTYDCRGHGRSGREAGHYTTDLFARDLAELLDHVGWQKAIVGGCSMGGCIAQAFAGRYGARAEALALIDTTAWYGEDAPKAWAERAAAAKTKGFAGMIDFQVTRWFGEAFRAAHPDVVQAIMRVFLANDVETYAASCRLLGEADLRPFLSGFRMPVSVIVGEEDYATPVAMAVQLHDAIQGSTFSVIPKGRHLTPIECPEQISLHLQALIQGDTSHHA